MDKENTSFKDKFNQHPNVMSSEIGAIISDEKSASPLSLAHNPVIRYVVDAAVSEDLYRHIHSSNLLSDVSLQTDTK